MENKNAIYNDDVERIVNEPRRQEAINAFHEKRQAKRQRKMLTDACVYATIGLAFGVLGVGGCITAQIAFPVMAVCGLYATFCCGRYFENGKCQGWM